MKNITKKNPSHLVSLLTTMLGCILVSSASAGDIPVTNSSVRDARTASGFQERTFRAGDLDRVTSVTFDNREGTKKGGFWGPVEIHKTAWFMEFHGVRTNVRETKREGSAIYLKEIDGIEEYKVDFTTETIYKRNHVNQPGWTPILVIKSAWVAQRVEFQ